MRALAWSVIGFAVFVGGASRVDAFFLDKGRNFDVRFRGYSQVAVSAEESRNVNPQFSPGDVLQQRNFYNPEFDAKLTDYFAWMNNVSGLSLLAPAEFKFRFAWWGFYDGLYDYGAPQWKLNKNGVLKGAARDAYAKFIAGSGANPTFGPMARQSQSENIARESFAFNDENRNLRNILGHRNRINELYVDYTNGPVFIRAGRQSISWGESDSISQLDVSNPFDLTQTAPGFFQDVDEARIPLYTLRTTIKLLDNAGPISSTFLDTYLVPGVIDTTIATTPSWFGQPGSQAGYDPMNAAFAGVNQQAIPGGLHVSIVDQMPENSWANSRWGARLVGVVNRDYTVQGWFFRTFPNQPAAQLVGTDPNGKATLIDNRGFRVSSCVDATGAPVKAGKFGHTSSGRACSYSKALVTVLHHRLESVIGASATWFSQPLNGIIRTEAEYFIKEQSVIPGQNLNPNVVFDKSVHNTVPTANYLRFILGYDTFFFMRWLNPSNSFTFVAAYQGQLNTSALHGRDFRSPGQVKPSGANQCSLDGKGWVDADGKSHTGNCTGAVLKLNPPATVYEDQYAYEHFFQIHIETDYMHGRLKPAVTMILDPSGEFGFAPSLTYRINDNLLAQMNYLAVEGSRQTGLATFRDRDQFQFRLTYQIN